MTIYDTDSLKNNEYEQYINVPINSLISLLFIFVIIGSVSVVSVFSFVLVNLVSS